MKLWWRSNASIAVLTPMIFSAAILGLSLMPTQKIGLVVGLTAVSGRDCTTHDPTVCEDCVVVHSSMLKMLIPACCASSLHCAPRPVAGRVIFCFSQSSTAGLFNDGKVRAIPLFVPKLVDLGHLCADLQARHRLNRFRSVCCMTVI
jgi:hypothetical protein